VADDERVVAVAHMPDMAQEGEDENGDESGGDIGSGGDLGSGGEGNGGK
jgi:hypothetical protein